VCSATTDQSVGGVQVQILPDGVVSGHTGGTSDAVLVEEPFLKGLAAHVARSWPKRRGKMCGPVSWSPVTLQCTCTGNAVLSDFLLFSVGYRDPIYGNFG